MISMLGIVSDKELSAALSLPAELKEKITAYERKNWAADLESPSLKDSWRHFLNSLEGAVNQDKLDDTAIIELIHYISTRDSALLLDHIGRLSAAKQERFMVLLNWVANESKNPQHQRNAQSVMERILMAYRLHQYPKVYAPKRLEQAIRLVTKKTSSFN
jgi:hypothetical protein